MSADERAAMDERAERFYRDNHRSDAIGNMCWNFMSAFSASEVLRALHECAKLVCTGCRDDKPMTPGQMHLWDTKIYECRSRAIHAKIAQLSGKESQ